MLPTLETKHLHWARLLLCDLDCVSVVDLGCALRWAETAEGQAEYPHPAAVEQAKRAHAAKEQVESASRTIRS